MCISGEDMKLDSKETLILQCSIMSLMQLCFVCSVKKIYLRPLGLKSYLVTLSMPISPSFISYFSLFITVPPLSIQKIMKLCLEDYVFVWELISTNYNHFWFYYYYYLFRLIYHRQGTIQSRSKSSIPKNGLFWN